MWESGADYGHVLAWKQGLPAAWTHAMHEDGMTTVVHDLCAAFDALLVEPNATSFACLKGIVFAMRKKSTSLGFAPGHPASIK